MKKTIIQREQQNCQHGTKGKSRLEGRVSASCVSWEKAIQNENVERDLDGAGIVCGQFPLLPSVFLSSKMGSKCLYI